MIQKTLMQNISDSISNSVTEMVKLMERCRLMLQTFVGMRSR